MNHTFDESVMVIMKTKLESVFRPSKIEEELVVVSIH